MPSKDNHGDIFTKIQSANYSVVKKMEYKNTAANDSWVYRGRLGCNEKEREIFDLIFIRRTANR